MLHLVAALLIPVTLQLPDQDAEIYKEYSVVHDTVSDSTNFNVEVTRGMALDNSGNSLWAISNYESSLMRFDLTSLSLSGTTLAVEKWRTLNEPVAIAETASYIYVLGQGTHALARHDKVTGRIVEVLKLPSEPADLVINDGEDKAYVSCMGADTVVEINIAASSMSVTEAWVSGDPNLTGFLIKRPRFLSWDEASGFLYVAPFLSGNNTLTLLEHDAAGDFNRNPQGTDLITDLPSSKLLDGYDTSNFPEEGLPDVDLFAIEVGSGAVLPVVRRAGTLLTAHGIHPDPAIGTYWMLGVDGRNDEFETEPEAKGQFATNSLAVVSANDLQSAGQDPLPFPSIVDLDEDPLSPSGYSDAHAMPFPYALEFGVGTQDWVAVGSSTLGRVQLLDDTGTLVHTLNLNTSATLPEGLVVRDLLFDNGLLYIYCQQSNNILIWPVSGLATPPVEHNHVLSLGSDPTPAAIARGRALFYNAELSQDSRFTCATCHPGGESDLLAWNLEEGVVDFKDPMVTQPLKGLSETFPFHWRGERNLHDFNGAFAGLLGSHRVLTTPELEDFEAFIFSLRPAANPLELVTRQLPGNSDFIPPGAPDGTLGSNPIAGQASFLGSTCNSCHVLPTGGNGSSHQDNDVSTHGASPWNARIEPAQIANFLQSRIQPMVVVKAGNMGVVDRPLLGVGNRHNGVVRSLQGFIENSFGGTFKTDKLRVDLSSFLSHLDTGTSPGAHHIIHLNQSSPSSTRDQIKSELRAQANKGWLDLVAFGWAPDDTGVYRRLSWLYNPGSNRFISDDPVNAALPRTLSWFGNFAGAGANKDNLFLGVLPGQGKRLGQDWDNDGLLNSDEVTYGTLTWDPDFDMDELPDGYEVNTSQDPLVDQGVNTDGTPPALATGSSVVVSYKNSALAQLQFETDEPCTWIVNTTTVNVNWPGAAPYEIISDNPALGIHHTAEIHGLLPSVAGTPQSYSAVVTLFDIKGNMTTLAPVTFDARDGDALGDQVLVGSLAWTNQSRSSTAPFSFTGDAEFRVDQFDDVSLIPQTGVQIVAQVVKRDHANDTWIRVPLADLSATGAEVVADFRVTNKNGNQPKWFTIERAAGGYGGAISGPFLILAPTSAVSGSEGTVQVQFTASNLDAQDQEVCLVIVAIPQNTTASNPTKFSSVDFAAWNMPKTPPLMRKIESTQ